MLVARGKRSSRSYPTRSSVITLASSLSSICPRWLRGPVRASDSEPRSPTRSAALPPHRAKPARLGPGGGWELDPRRDLLRPRLAWEPEWQRGPLWPDCVTLTVLSRGAWGPPCLLG